MKKIICLAILTAAVVGAALGAASNQSVNVSWSPGSALSASYSLYVYTNSSLSSNAVYAIYRTTNTTVTVTNIIPGNVYWLNAKAQDTNGLESDFSSSIQFGYPTAPLNLTLKP